jgi:uncharacterized protein YodC (DUF2158 family)
MATTMTNYIPGHVVMLKSGDPSMTVKFVEDGTVYCVWFDKQTRHEAGFEAETLVSMESPPGPLRSVYVGRG